MTLKILNRFPGGNAVSIRIDTNEEIPEVIFASDPCGGTEALWFYFKLSENEPDAKHSKVRLTWAFVDNVSGGSSMTACIPVSCVSGHTWARLKQGEESRTPEGFKQLSWLIPHPSPQTEIAFCFPYGPQDLNQAVQRSKDFWQETSIGISQGGRKLSRVYNTMGSATGSHPGIYIMARQFAGETPGSWVLDGFMRHWAQSKRAGYVIWAHPLADADGIACGQYGRGAAPDGMARAWGEPAARHEAEVYKQDVLRWKERCRPSLALDLQAAKAGERDGIYALLSDDPEEVKWANVIQNELQKEYAADDFRRAGDETCGPGSLAGFMRETVHVPTLVLRIPYALAGPKVLSQKHYREMGQQLAAAILKRKG